MKTTIIGVVLALFVGSGLGYGIGKASMDTSAQDNKLQDSVAMMKEQSANIQQMGDLMKSAGAMLQDMGMRYKDENATMKGKDLEAVAAKYLAEDKKAAEEDPAMKDAMQ